MSCANRSSRVTSGQGILTTVLAQHAAAGGVLGRVGNRSESRRDGRPSHTQPLQPRNYGTHIFSELLSLKIRSAERPPDQSASHALRDERMIAPETASRHCIGLTQWREPYTNQPRMGRNSLAERATGPPKRARFCAVWGG